MTTSFADVIDSLPNGLHDALVHELVVAPAEARIVMDLDVWTGDLDGPEEQRDEYRRGRLTLTGIERFSLDVEEAAIEQGKPVMIDAETGGPGTVPDLWPSEPDDRKLWIFFNDWNGFLRVLGGQVEFEWGAFHQLR